ncbi:hypothetical protein HZA38_06555 [Candidatus Peregrinibacteria bacterium]|nr:hypothetical protein [Candidatus Peregrinibacteria bacterium]
MNKKIGAILASAFIFLSLLKDIPEAQAAQGVPRLLHHQGRILDRNGNLLGGAAGRDYCFRFSLYGDATVGGDPDIKLWPLVNPLPATMTVNVKNGIFDVNIGSGDDALTYNFEDNDSVFLNVEVVAQVNNSCVGVNFENLSPRQRVVSSPYALNAAMVRGFTPSESASGNQIPVLTNGDLILSSLAPGLSLGTAGVKLTGDGDGALTFLGMGNGTDEDLTFNFDDVENTISITSSTGVTTVDFGAIGISAATLNTGQGANELYDMNQNVQTSDAVQFASFQIDSNSTGVNLDTDADGMLIIAGTGDGFDEDLRLNLDDTENTVSITSATGVTNVTFSSIDVIVPTEVYDANGWNGDNSVPTKDAVRDKIEALGPGGSGDITAVGDVGDGAAFDGTQGTTLTFNDADGDKTFKYDTANNWFEVNAPLAIGSAGVKLSDDGDGAISLLGMGDGFDEGVTLNLDDTENTVSITSSTGVTTVDFGVLGVSAATVNTGQGAYEVYAMDQNVLTTSAPTFATVNTGQGAYELYSMDQNVLTTSAPTFATVNTGQGAYELYSMDQNVLTTSAPTFATVNTGQGAYELYSMDQNVLTTSSVQFADLALLFGAGNDATIDADTTNTTQTTGVLNIDVGTQTNTASGINLKLVDDNGDAGADTLYGMVLEVDDNATDVDDTTYGLYLDSLSNGVTDTDQVASALLAIDNSDADDAIADGILFISAGGGFTDFIDTPSSVFKVTGAGAITGATIDTGQGAKEVYSMDQNVLTTSAPTFATVNTGQGAYELYSMDQNVLTTSSVQFADLALLFGAGNDATIDADTTNTTQTTGVLNIDVGTQTNTASGINLKLVDDNGDAGADTLYGMVIEVDDNATDVNDTTYGLYIDSLDNGAADTDQVASALIALDNSDATAADVVDDGIVFIAGSFANGIDMSGADITVADIVLEQGETIDNTVDGEILLTATTTDISGLLEAGSSNIAVTLATGMIDADAITLAPNDGAGGTASASGLETGSDGLTLLQGCTDGQLLEWTDAGGWACAADDNSGGATALNALLANSTGDDAALLNADNTIEWDWALTSAGSKAFTIAESTAGANGVGDQHLLKLATLATSTAGPLEIVSNSADGGDVEINLNSAGDFEIQDAGTAFVTFSDAGLTTFVNDVDFTLGAGENLNITASAASTADIVAINNSGQATVTSGTDGVALTFVQGADAAADTNYGMNLAVSTTGDHAGDVLAGINIDLTNASTAAGGQRGLVITNINDAADATTEALIALDNAEGAASTVTDAIIITSSGVNGGVVDAIDVSAANITTAIRVNANAIEATELDFNVAPTGSTSSLSIVTDNPAEDFTLEVTGATDSSLFLSSSGTGADAMKLTTTAGGLDISVTGDAGGEDLDITTVGAATELRLSSGSTVADAIAISSTADQGGVHILAGDGEVAAVGTAEAIELRATSDTIVALTAAGSLVVDGDTTNSTNTDGALDINVGTTTTGAMAANITIQDDTGDGGADTIYGLVINVDDNATDVDDTTYGLYLDSLSNGVTDTDQVASALLAIDNSDADDVIADGILFISAGGGFTDFIDTPSSVFKVTGAGAITGITLNTGQGAYELYAMDQNVLTTSTPTFASGSVLGSLTFTTNNIADSGALTIKSATTNALTLDSGTTGNVNLGTGNNAKTIAIGTGTAGNTFNIGTDNTTKDTINIGSALDDVAITGDQWSITNAGVLTVASCTGCGAGHMDLLAESTLGGAANTITLNVAAREFMNCYVSTKGNTATAITYLRFNGDSGNNYDYQLNYNIATAFVETQGLAQAQIVLDTTDTESWHGQIQVANFSDADKSMWMRANRTDASTGPDNFFGSGSWHNTAAQITSVAFLTSASTFLAGSHGWCEGRNVADYAENYYSKDLHIEAGDIVTHDPSLPAGIQKSSKPYDPQLIGAISTDPAIVLDDAIGFGEGWQYPVALAGRIPVKVNTENGPINSGDPLTSSSEPGIAMKATKAGAIIGLAMESYDGEGVGKVLTFVKTSYYNGTSVPDLISGSEEGILNADERTNTSTSILDYIVNERLKYTEDTALSEITADRVVAGLEVITPKVLAGEVATDLLSTATGTDLTIGLGPEGKLIIASLTSSADDSPNNETRTPVITFDALGNAFFAGEVTAEKVSAKSIDGLEIITEKISKISSTVDGLTSYQTWATPESVESLATLIQGLSDTSVGLDTRITALEFQTPNFATIEGLTTLSETTTTLQTNFDAESLRLDGLESRITALENGTGVNLSELSVSQSLSVTGNTTLSGGLVVNTISGIGDFLNLMTDTNLIGRPYFNADTAGFAVIQKDASQVEIPFEKEYLDPPVVTASIAMTDTEDHALQETLEQMLLTSDLRFIVTRIHSKGFTILLNKPTTSDVRFSWIALAVKNARTEMSEETYANASEPPPEDEVTSGEVTLESEHPQEVPPSQPPETTEPPPVSSEESPPEIPEGEPSTPSEPPQLENENLLSSSPNIPPEIPVEETSPVESEVPTEEPVPPMLEPETPFTSPPAESPEL